VGVGSYRLYDEIIVPYPSVVINKVAKIKT